MNPDPTYKCPVCGHQLETVDKFCTSCGGSLDELGKKKPYRWGGRFRQLRWMIPGIAGLTVMVGLLLVTLANLCACSPPRSQEYLHIQRMRSVFDAHNVSQRYQSFDEMTFEDLKGMAVEVEYSEVVDDYPKYTFKWFGDYTPPMLYFKGELADIEDPGSLGFKESSYLWEEMWLGRLRLEDGNMVLINAVNPPSSVGDVLDVVVVCKDRRSDSPLPDCNAIDVNEID